MDDVGDVSRAPSRMLDAQRRRLLEELGMTAHHPAVGAGPGLERVQASLLVVPKPAVQSWQTTHSPSSGWSWMRAATVRTIRPLSREARRGLVASAISA
jgi:hypothetical protein